MTDLILGMGEVGSTLYDLLSERNFKCTGIDLDKTMCREDHSLSFSDYNFLHVCIPGTLPTLSDTVLTWVARLPNLDAVLIHSTVKPGTTKHIQSKCIMPVFHSPVNGVHKRFLQDMKRYTKFISVDGMAIDAELAADLQNRFRKIQWVKNTKTTELSKILVDTTYYGWLITYAQITKMICEKEGVDYNEMWKFADEIHSNLGNRPKMYPGFIGGKCVIPNLSLIDYDYLDLIKKINEEYKTTIQDHV